MSTSNLSNLSSSEKNLDCRALYEPYVFKISLIVVYCMVLLVGLTGNALIITLVYKRKDLRNAINQLIANMTFSDCLSVNIHSSWVGKSSVWSMADRWTGRINRLQDPELCYVCLCLCFCTKPNLDCIRPVYSSSLSNESPSDFLQISRFGHCFHLDRCLFVRLRIFYWFSNLAQKWCTWLHRGNNSNFSLCWSRLFLCFVDFHNNFILHYSSNSTKGK